MFKRVCCFAVQNGQIALKRRCGSTSLNELKIGSNRRIFLGTIVECPFGVSNSLCGKGQLSTRYHGHRLKLTDGLTGCGHHATDTINLVAKKLKAHRTGGLSREHVNRIAMYVKRTGNINFSGIDISHTHKKRWHLFKRHLVSHRKGAWYKIARSNRWYPAQKCMRARNHNALLARRKACNGIAAHTDTRIIRRCV